jgi:hypothetical protein
MATQQDFFPDELFEEDVRPSPEDSSRLDRVAARQKAMEWATWPVRAIDECHEDYIDFVAAAAARGLTLFQVPDNSVPEYPAVRVYALHPENLWRASAHGALLEVQLARPAWSVDAEEMQSYLLGYTEDERRAWHAYNDWRRLGWAGQTIYFLMKQQAQARITSLAGRCLDPSVGDRSVLIVLAVFGVCVKKDSLARLPSDTFMARAAVRHDVIPTLFGPAGTRPSAPIHTRLLSADTLDEINCALLSSLQFLTADGWR